MFIKREDLVDMLEVIDCENGYVDLDHLVECCNNLPSSGMSVWCMKCENNGECMTIDKPNCFQPRQADTPQTDCGKDINVRSKDEPQWTKENCKGCKYNEYPYDSGTCFVRVCINGNKYEPKDEPQTENLFTDKYGDVWEWRGDAWYCISGDEPQTDCAWR